MWGCRLRDGVVAVAKGRGRSRKRQLIKRKPKQELLGALSTTESL